MSLSVKAVRGALASRDASAPSRADTAAADTPARRPTDADRAETAAADGPASAETATRAVKE